MATARPPGRSCGALPRWLLAAALLLGLRLCMELHGAGSGSSGRSDPPGPPRPHLLPAPGPPRDARRRQVTYVRSGRRALPRGGGSTTLEPSCCTPRELPRRKGPRWHIELQPWAGPAQSLDEEASRFLSYISTTQIACDHMGTNSLAADSSPATKPWLVCLDDRFGLAHQIRSKRCRLYSLGLGNDDTHFEVSMANDGCEVHRFDPSVKSAHILESQRLWHHRLSIDWRDPHPAVAAQKLHSNTRKLGSILNEFGHHKNLSRSLELEDRLDGLAVEPLGCLSLPVPACTTLPGWGSELRSCAACVASALPTEPSFQTLNSIPNLLNFPTISL